MWFLLIERQWRNLCHVYYSTIPLIQALWGVNLVLAYTGQEQVFRKVFNSIGVCLVFTHLGRFVIQLNHCFEATTYTSLIGRNFKFGNNRKV